MVSAVWDAVKRASGLSGLLARPASTVRSGATVPPPVAGATPSARAAWLEQTLQEYVTTLGPQHHRSIAARNNLAAKYAQVGRRTEAISQFERALEDSVSALGEDDPQTDVIRENLAGTLDDARRYEEATHHWLELLRQREQRFGPRDVSTVQARAGLATAYRRTGQLDSAVTHFERALADDPDPGGERVESLRVGLALAHRASGRFETAAQQLRMVQAQRMRRLGPRHPDTLSVQLHLGRLQLTAGRFAAGTRTLEQAYGEALTASDDPDVRVLTMRLRRELAQAYRAMGRERAAAALR
ncbi:tetratricopeptide repeat protein [Lipingzhangella rawalii]|uniref:tetratricopeptide repeat protein n=1 Tax=Lipingzhangella rawalii TaxID=2055835 RepID=UPI00287B6878|nr:tetratricopeptide repeat protein [Lipingzhangella rawalii]